LPSLPMTSQVDSNTWNTDSKFPSRTVMAQISPLTTSWASSTVRFSHNDSCPFVPTESVNQSPVRTNLNQCLTVRIPSNQKDLTSARQLPASRHLGSSRGERKEARSRTQSNIFRQRSFEMPVSKMQFRFDADGGRATYSSCSVGSAL